MQFAVTMARVQLLLVGLVSVPNGAGLSPRLTMLALPQTMWVKVLLDGAVMTSLPAVLLNTEMLVGSGNLTRLIALRAMLNEAEVSALLVNATWCIA